MRLLLADDESTLRRAASELLLSRGEEKGECVSEMCESVKSVTLDQRKEREREREICMDMWKRGCK